MRKERVFVELMLHFSQLKKDKIAYMLKTNVTVHLGALSSLLVSLMTRFLIATLMVSRMLKNQMNIE